MPRLVPRPEALAPVRALADRRPVPTSLLIRPPRLLARPLSPAVPLPDASESRVLASPRVLALPCRVLIRRKATPASRVEVVVPVLTVLPTRGSSIVCTSPVLVNRVLARRRRVPSALTLADLLRVVPTPVPSDVAVWPNAMAVDRPVLVILVTSISIVVVTVNVTCVLKGSWVP